MVEANRRKAAFLVHAAAALGLSQVEVIARRAEDAGRDPKLREHFDAAVARALAPMAVLAELCLPLVRVGGSLLAMKTAAADEVSDAQEAIARLGGTVEGLVAAPSDLRTWGQIVIVRKVKPTPAAYPRRPGVPNRRPLGK